MIEDNYLSVRLMRHRSCCSNFNVSFGCCWFCVSTSLRLFPELVEIHLPWLVCWLARTTCLARDGNVDVTFVNFENMFLFFRICGYVYLEFRLIWWYSNSLLVLLYAYLFGCLLIRLWCYFFSGLTHFFKLLNISNAYSNDSLCESIWFF